jgi:hypothetical protein
MTIHFQFTLEDYQDAFRAHLRKGASASVRWMLKIITVAGFLLIAMGIVMLATGQRNLSTWLTPGVLGCLWVWIGTGRNYRRVAKSQFTKNPALRQPRTVEITSDGIKTDAGIASGDTRWAAYLNFVESDKVFLLYTSPGCFVIIPKRVLQTSQTDELREILQTHIGNKAAAVGMA